MRFAIARASDPLDKSPAPPSPKAVRNDAGDGWVVEISTLEELMDLHDKVRHELIVDRSSIWIYDGYME